IGCDRKRHVARIAADGDRSRDVCANRDRSVAEDLTELIKLDQIQYRRRIGRGVNHHRRPTALRNQRDLQTRTPMVAQSSAEASLSTTLTVPVCANGLLLLLLLLFRFALGLNPHPASKARYAITAAREKSCRVLRVMQGSFELCDLHRAQRCARPSASEESALASKLPSGNRWRGKCLFG